MTQLLCNLRVGEEAVLINVQANGDLRRRLMAMGFVRGAGLKIIRVAPFGDPMEVSIKGYHLSLRRNECAMIEVDKKV